jgi:hypothetical protein
MAYTIKEESRSEMLSPAGVQTTRVFQVSPWAARGEAYADLLGGVRFIGGRLVRIPPLSDPAYLPARVSEIRTEPVEEDTLNGDVYGNNYNPLLRHAPYRGPARLTVTYKTPDGSASDPLGPNDPQTIDNAAGSGSSEVQEIELATLGWDFSAQNLTLPNKYFQWAGGTDGGKLLQNQNVAATITIPRFEISLERKFVIRKPVVAICALLGKVNQESVRIGFDTYPAETVRFDSAQVRQAITNLGIKFFNITYKFTVMPVYDTIETGAKAFVGWNRLFNPRTAQWTKVHVVGDGAPIHRFDTTVSQTLAGRVVSGYGLLFHPAAV